MSRWLTQHLAPLRGHAGGVLLIRDPDDVLPGDGVQKEVIPAETVSVRNWWGLRAAYERMGRHRLVTAPPFVIHVGGEEASQPLPWDIERAAAEIIDLRLPGPAPVRRALARLPGSQLDDPVDAVVRALDEGRNPSTALLEAVTGLDIPSQSLTAARQFRLAARLAVGHQSGTPQEVLDLAIPIVGPNLSGLLADPPDAGPVQSAWHAVLGGHETGWTEAFPEGQSELGELFALGILQRGVPSPAAPKWALVGSRRPTVDEELEAALGQRPEPEAPATSAEWCRLAEWWGSVRRMTATASPSLRERAWSAWLELDARFDPWLRENYGRTLASAAAWPSGLHRVGPFLARRRRDGLADRILLIVLDGLGHTQWAHIREMDALVVHESGSTFAMVPTYTTVSRQAIFAGDLPVSFPTTLWTTQPEARHWRRFWAAEGLDVTGASYHRVRGHFPQDKVDFGAARAVGVVVNAVDNFMHSSKMLGDAQLQANLDAWMGNSFLADLVAAGTRAGFEIWITSDHGNLECLPAGTVSEGLGIEAGGKRLVRYPNPVLRSSTSARGIIWDDIPGLPSTVEPLLFAPGRMAFTDLPLSVSHGGLSFDEVIVPLVRVSAP